MTRIRTVFAVVASLLVGGVVFEVGRGQADPWGAPTAPPPPSGPMPPTPPKAPKAPKPPKVKIHGTGNGISVSLNGGKIQINGLDQLVAGHLQAVQHMLANHPNLPKDLRDKINARMARVNAIVNKYAGQFDTSDMDKLEDQIEKMGDELEKAMEGLEQDLEKLGDKLGKDLAKDLAKDLKGLKFGPNAPGSDDDDDDDDDDKDTDDDGLQNADPSSDIDAQALDSLKGFALKPAQKDAIDKYRAAADKQVELERLKLEVASKELENALADVDVKPAAIEGYVDRITTHEAAIRKARLLSWVKARSVLDADQRKQLEDATRTK